MGRKSNEGMGTDARGFHWYWGRDLNSKRKGSVKIKTLTRDKEAAQRIYQEYLDRRDLATTDGFDLTLSQCNQLFVDNYHCNATPIARANHDGNWGRIVDQLGDIRPSDPNASVKINGWIASVHAGHPMHNGRPTFTYKRPKSAKRGRKHTNSLKTYVTLLRTIVNWCIKNNGTNGHPYLPTRFKLQLNLPVAPKNEKPRASSTQFLREQQIQAVTALEAERRAARGETRHSINERIWAVSFGVAGQRAYHTSKLKWSHFNWRTWTVNFAADDNVQTSVNKPAKEEAAIHPDCREFFRACFLERTSDYVFDGPLSHQAYKNRMRGMLARIGVKGGSHISRYTFATLGTENSDPSHVAKAMGTSLKNLSENYLQEDRERDARTVAATPSPFGRGGEKVTTLRAATGRPEKAG